MMLAGSGPPWRMVYYFIAVSTVAPDARMLGQGFSLPRLESLPVLLGIVLWSGLALIVVNSVIATAGQPRPGKSAEKRSGEVSRSSRR